MSFLSLSCEKNVWRRKDFLYEQYNGLVATSTGYIAYYSLSHNHSHEKVMFRHDQDSKKGSPSPKPLWIFYVGM